MRFSLSLVWQIWLRNAHIDELKEVSIEDLLGRDAVAPILN